MIVPSDLEHSSNWDTFSTITCLTCFPVRLQIGAQGRQGTVLAHCLCIIQWQTILHKRQLKDKYMNISPLDQGFQKCAVYSTALCIFHTPGYLCKNMNYNNICWDSTLLDFIARSKNLILDLQWVTLTPCYKELCIYRQENSSPVVP